MHARAAASAATRTRLRLRYNIFTDSKGLDVAELTRLKDQDRSVCDYPGGGRLDRDAVIGVECDIWIPAARPDVVREDNADRLRARLVLQGANIPFSREAEKSLAGRGLVIVPDFIANAGGVICAAMGLRRFSIL